MASGAEGHGFFAGFGALRADADVIHMYDTSLGTFVAHDSASMRPAAVFDVKHSDVCEVPPRPTPFMQGHSRVHSFHPSPHINSTSPYAGTDAGAWPHPLPPQPPGSVHRVQPQHMAFAHSSSPAGVLHPNAAQGARYYGARPFGSPPPPCLDPFQGHSAFNVRVGVGGLGGAAPHPSLRSYTVVVGVLKKHLSLYIPLVSPHAGQGQLSVSRPATAPTHAAVGERPSRRASCGSRAGEGAA